MKKITLFVFGFTKEHLSNIENINSYNSMKSFFIHQSIKSSNINKSIKCVYMPEIFKKSKHNTNLFLNFLDTLEYPVHNIVFAYLNQLDLMKNKNLILDKITGNLYHFRDKDRRIDLNKRICTIGHYQENENKENFCNAGLTVANNIFVPCQDWSTTVFKIHVDHHLSGRKSILPQIKNVILKIKNSIIDHSYWTDIQLTYHNKIVSIEELIEESYQNSSITDLAKIYGESNIAFLNHTETLGQYPLEMLSCGVSVVSKKTLLPSKVYECVNIIDIDNIDIDQILDVAKIKQRIIDNRDCVSEYTFENYLNKIFEFIR